MGNINLKKCISVRKKNDISKVKKVYKEKNYSDYVRPMKRSEIYRNIFGRLIGGL